MKSTKYVHESIKQKQCRVCCWSGELVLHSTHTYSNPPRPKQRWIANGGNWLLDQPLVQPPTTTTRIPTEFLSARRPFCQQSNTLWCEIVPMLCSDDHFLILHILRIWQTWNLSKILHDQIFGPKILHTKKRVYRAYFCQRKNSISIDFNKFGPFVVEIDIKM